MNVSISKRLLIAGLLLVFPGSFALAQNPPNGNCYSSIGDQYYVRAYNGSRNMGEVAICDERVGNYTHGASCRGYGFYLSAYALNWVRNNAGKYQIWVIVKDKRLNATRICRFK